MGAIGTRKMGYDEKTIRQFENMCKIQCTAEEIAGVFEVSEATIRRWVKEVYNQSFDKIYKRYSASGRMSLRRHQFVQGEKNPIMAIWLGKQYLGQTDQANVRIQNDDQEDDLTKAIKESIKRKRGKTVAKSVDLDDDSDDDDDE